MGQGGGSQYLPAQQLSRDGDLEGVVTWAELQHREPQARISLDPHEHLDWDLRA